VQFGVQQHRRAIARRTALAFYRSPSQEEAFMAKYLIRASYSADGVKGVMQAGGTSRVRAVERAVEGVGGSLESFYFAFGTDDVYVTVDVPDNTAALAMAAAVGSSGALENYQTIVLLEPSEVDKAMNVAVDYAPPGS
jgi:uncharacterized protein with GYD domain